MQAQEDLTAAPELRRRFAHRAAAILWPSFLIAGALDMATFAVVDPADLYGFGGVAIDWSRQAIYTVTFLIYWGFISLSSALTVLLLVEPDDAGGGGSRLNWP